jgi:hypothetical protein
MEGKHTPGPWTLALYDNGCFTVTGTMGDMHGAILCSRSDVPDRFVGEGSANAHLIAAAPELLEALKSLTNEARGFLSMADPEAHGQTNLRCLDRRIDEAEAAVAKAEGR